MRSRPNPRSCQARVRAQLRRKQFEDENRRIRADLYNMELEAAEDWACQHDCPSMSVRSNVIRDRAHKFYERQGYEHYKTQKAFRKTL